MEVKEGEPWVCLPCNGLATPGEAKGVVPPGTIIAGHWTETGKKCCPHFPKGCGFQHEFAKLRPEDEFRLMRAKPSLPAR